MTHIARSSTTHLIALLAAVALLVGCDNIGSFDITEESQEVVVDGGPSLGNLPVNNLLPPVPLTINLQEELEERNADGAQAVYLTDLRMEITDTAIGQNDEDNFDFVDTIEVYVESRDANTSLEPRQIATLNDVPEGQMEVTFDTDEDVDLKPYIEEGIRLTTEGQGSVPEDDTSLRAIVTVTVEVF